MIVRQAVLVVALALLTVLGVATPAWAHAKLQSSSPAQGASLSAAPTRVVLTFGEPVRPARNPITVTGTVRFTLTAPASP